MTQPDIDAALYRLKLTDLWGIAGRMEARLNALGIHTPLQLRDADPRHLRERLGVVIQRMVMELRGEPCMELEEGTPDRKSIMASRSFGNPVTTYQEMREAVSTDVAPKFYPGVIRVLALVMPCWAGVEAVRGAEPSGERSAADRRAAA